MILSFYYNLLHESFSLYFSCTNLGYCFLNDYLYLYISSAVRKYIIFHKFTLMFFEHL